MYEEQVSGGIDEGQVNNDFGGAGGPGIGLRCALRRYVYSYDSIY